MLKSNARKLVAYAKENGLSGKMLGPGFRGNVGGQVVSGDWDITIGGSQHSFFENAIKMLENRGFEIKHLRQIMTEESTDLTIYSAQLTAEWDEENA